MHVCSFGRSGLWPVAGEASWRRVLRLLLAARRRWPDGRLSFRGPVGFVRSVDIFSGRCDGWGVELRPVLLSWLWADGSCGVLVQPGFPRERCWLLPEFLFR